MAGAASKLDRISSHREILGYQLEFKQRQSQLATDLEDLLALTGRQGSFESRRLSAPSSPAVQSSGADDLPEASLLLQVEPLEQTLKELALAEYSPPGSDHPEVRSQELTALAARQSAESESSRLWPQINVSARTSLDYPNGPILQRINQNTISASLSFPLFEWSRTRRAADQKMGDAVAAEYRRSQLESDLLRDWRKAKEQLTALRDQLQINRQTVSEAEEQAKLSYATYRLGRISLVDVQNANLRVLEAKVQTARILTQLLMEEAQLQALSKKDQT